MTSVDYLLTESQQEAYEEMLELDENAELPQEVQVELAMRFFHRINDIDYIKYTGYSRQGDAVDKYSLDEFIMEMKNIGIENDLWPVMVAMSGAGVVWKELE